MCFSVSRQQRDEIRAKLVAELRNSAQGLTALQEKQRQQAGDRGDQPSLIGGDSPEAQAVYSALEQCLFHDIRAKEFGEAMVPP